MTAATDRTLRWDGLLNVREAGGLPLDDGGTVRRGALVRADSLHGLTDEGWRALADHGVRRVVDLRTEQERESDPPRPLELDVVHVPIAGRSPEDVETGVSEGRAESLVAAASGYHGLLERERASLATAAEAFADAPDGAVVVHCVAGKDRTGLLVAMLLDVAGVPRDAIVADYGLSGANVEARYQAWIDRGSTELEREIRRARVASPPDAMRDALDDVDRSYGGSAAYLADDGSAEDLAARVRARLRP